MAELRSLRLDCQGAGWRGVGRSDGAKQPLHAHQYQSTRANASRVAGGTLQVDSPHRTTAHGGIFPGGRKAEAAEVGSDGPHPVERRTRPGRKGPEKGESHRSEEHTSELQS